MFVASTESRTFPIPELTYTPSPTLPATVQPVTFAVPAPVTKTALLVVVVNTEFVTVPVPLATYSPCWSFSNREPVTIGPPPAARTPWIALEMVAPVIAAEVAPVGTTMPYHTVDPLPVIARMRTGESAVPFTVRVPFTVSSTRLGSRPVIWESVDAN